MQRGFSHIRWILLAAVTFAAACAPIVDRHGYAPNDLLLDEILVGIDTKSTVADTVGQPTAAGILSSGGWYYVESVFETVGPFEKKEVGREVVAISFDSRDVVTNIERFGLDDGNVVVLSRRVTDSNIQGMTFLRQLLGNIGTFSLEGADI